MDFKINNVYGTYKVYRANDSLKAHKTDNTHGALSFRDAFTLSVQAEDYQHIRKTLSGVPDVRMDRVHALRAKIEDGQYAISASAVAEKILQAYETHS